MAADTKTIRRREGPGSTDPTCFNRLHHALPCVDTAKPGDLVVFETRDCIDGQIPYGGGPELVPNVDLGLVHPMTGPVAIEGAEPGDVLAVTIVDIEPAETGITLIVPGFCFLRDVFDQPAVMHWRLTRDHATVDRLPGIKVPNSAFPGSIGVLPGPREVADALSRERALAEAGGVVMLPDPHGALPAHLFGDQGAYRDEALRTIPPREFGGNMDVRTLTVGSTLLVPVFVPGAGLWCGDVHFAQGDGEVCGSAIEMAARVTVRCEVRKGAGQFLRAPAVEGRRAAREVHETYAATGIPLKREGEVPPHLEYLSSPKLAALANLSEDLGLAARNALLDVIDWMSSRYALSRADAYMIASVAVDLRIAQVVDAPNCLVTAEVPLSIFENV
ncbi:MAG TPA: acetamidase/formamidase family protein [Allosphingosinicella sp.]|nr:acetamidase/formamidase family protein [Allosphingosinicella sp.]